MAIGKLVPMLYTKKMDETVDFYTNVLGFSRNAYWPAAGLASLQLDNTEIMLAHPVEHLAFEKPAFAGSSYFKTNEVDILYIKLKTKAKICYELENSEYGMTEFAIYDNNGFLLQFGQQL